jgi:predicted nucleic acid-binding protein
MDWLADQALDRQYVSAITIGELHFGAWRLPKGRKRATLERWLQTVEEDYAGRIVPLDTAIAVQWGLLRARLPNMPLLDAQIAATAMTYGFTLVTRNVKDFRIDSLPTLNPWQPGRDD